MGRVWDSVSLVQGSMCTRMNVYTLTLFDGIQTCIYACISMCVYSIVAGLYVMNGYTHVNLYEPHSRKSNSVFACITCCMIVCIHTCM